MSAAGVFMLGMNAVSTLAFLVTSVIFAGLTAPLLMILSRRSYSFWKYSLPCDQNDSCKTAELSHGHLQPWANGRAAEAHAA